MYANQNNYSPVGSPIKNHSKKHGESPAGSPLKMPRSNKTAFDNENAYVPISKEQVLGKPIEIIQGKCF
jgi:hypothetical protein